MLYHYSVALQLKPKGIIIKPEQLKFYFMDGGEPCPTASNPPVDVGPSDDEQEDAAVLLIFPAPEQAPLREEGEPFDHRAITSIESASRMYI